MRVPLREPEFSTQLLLDFRENVLGSVEMTGATCVSPDAFAAADAEFFGSGGDVAIRRCECRACRATALLKHARHASVSSCPTGDSTSQQDKLESGDAKQRFDAITSRWRSLWPSRPCRDFPVDPFSTSLGMTVEMIVVPTVLRERGYRFFFFKADRYEPPHIHVQRDDCAAKLWLDPLEFAYVGGFPSHACSEILRITKAHLDELLQAWYKNFGGLIGE